MASMRLLVVEDDADIARLLRYYFTGLGYQVDVAARGRDALEITRQVMPHLIILDIVLPDLDGYEICRTLRLSTLTSHIPVIFLTQKDERSSRLQGLELGADDYITKPFDIEELRLRVQNALARAERERLTDPLTCLPAGPLVEKELQGLLTRRDWAVLDIRLNNYEFFRSHQSLAAAQDFLQRLARMLAALLDEGSTQPDFLGHAGGANFILITSQDRAESLTQTIKEHFIDLDPGSPPVSQPVDTSQPLLSLSIGTVGSTGANFKDIREITETAAESRRRDIPAVVAERKP